MLTEETQQIIAGKTFNEQKNQKYLSLDFIPDEDVLRVELPWLKNIFNFENFLTVCLHQNKDWSEKNKFITYFLEIPVNNPFNYKENRIISYIEYIYPAYFDNELVAFQQNKKFENPFQGLICFEDLFVYSTSEIQEIIMQNLDKPEEYIETKKIIVDGIIHINRK